MIRATEILDKRPDIFVISDEAYDFLTFDGRQHHHFANYGNNWEKTVTIYSAGKLMNCTGWKVGWTIGPADLIKEMALVHETNTFAFNVPGQIAIANSLPLLNQPYEGHVDYPSFVRHTFQETRDKAIEVLSASDIPFNPILCESGYFILADVSKARHLVPSKYFKAGNYETDPNTQVLQKEFTNKVPLDYAFTRWFCIEKGLVVMPGTAFCKEAEEADDSYIRVAICKDQSLYGQVAEKLGVKL
jgi:aspartate/methionine/tyrosine aminotransferase